ncbi:hypothetical protein D9M71_619910 [compost metagenome]
MPSSPSTSGSSACSGTKTTPLPPLFTRSRPWSKNCPNRVNQELKPADRPSSGAVLGTNSGWPLGIAAPLRSSSVPTGKATPSGSSCVPLASTPSPASTKACTATGLPMVWSTIRLEMIRGSESTTLASGPLVA